jgi:hypothetical protein
MMALLVGQIGFATGDAMPYVSTPILIGGAVAAGLAVSQYKPRKGEDLSDRNWKRFVILMTTFAPGVIVAQVGYSTIIHFYPTLTKIDGVELLCGAVFGGVGLRLLLSLWERLPLALTNRIMGAIPPNDGTPGEKQ